jgi:hypothetical protein
MTCSECDGSGKLQGHFCDIGCVSRGYCLPEEMGTYTCGYCEGEEMSMKTISMAREVEARMTKPMTDERLEELGELAKRCQENDEKVSATVLCETLWEIHRLREDNERQDKTISALHKQTTLRGKEIHRLREDVTWHVSQLKRVAEAAGVETPMQLTAIAKNDKETTADLLVKFVQRLREDNDAYQQENDEWREIHCEVMAENTKLRKVVAKAEALVRHTHFGVARPEDIKHLRQSLRKLDEEEKVAKTIKSPEGMRKRWGY